MDEFLKSKYDNLILSDQKKDESRNTFFKTLSTLSAALLGLLVGLKPSLISDQNAKTAFIICLISIATCIIFSIGTMYYEVLSSIKIFNTRKQELSNYVKKNEEYSITLFHRKHWIFWLFELLALLSMIVYLAFLIIYVYHIEY
ncbi:hypothetical protein AWN68_05410 [Roseivirga echinicomitans]|uniref:DUF202 domain-containing protein n=1 Tax=Roseivirga echinicomitans TaxID=296218 RepID=A0A150XCM5_9BACT|nr:hypothetical protein AWN68_05410 [Roseivirga echinicomitans]|tara:strand:+ start:263 stop:694 length:432 start_codon:yes stop_codon:yes gene_type:complete